MNAETMMIVSLGVALGLGAAANAQEKAAVQPPEGAPEYEAPPRPTDGVNMALTVEKLEKGFDPERPLLIWAIGSSFTNGLGDGSALVEMLKSRFPNMPKVIYKRMAGNSTPYHLTRGWARHLVIPEQPDVVLIYNFGKAEDVEKLVVDLRQHTTADILVARCTGASRTSRSGASRTRRTAIKTRRPCAPSARNTAWNSSRTVLRSPIT